MKTLLNILKWIANVVMAIVLILGVIDSFGMKTVSDMSPTAPDDLGWAQITVKSISATPQGFVLSAEEYSTRFIVLLVPPPDSFKTLVQPGHKINLAVKKEAVGNLQNVLVLQAYSLMLENGQKLFDTSQTITRLPPDAMETGRSLFHKMIAIPLIYFAALVLYPLIRRKITKQA